MDKKYVSEKEDGIANCPFCRGVLLRDFKVDKLKNVISFVMRCPHCEEDVLVIINKELTIQKLEKS